MKKIPVNIITGFLGSGKTTAIANFLKTKPRHEKWAVIINEFGSVAIDTTTLKSEFAKEDSIIEIAGGCICCSSKEYFEDHVNRIVESYAPDRILVEPTGLGGLPMVKEIIEQFPSLKMMPVICLVDVRGATFDRLRINPIYRSQIHGAQIIAISKCDLDNSQKDAEDLLRWIKQDFLPKYAYTCIKKGVLDSKFLSLGEKTLKANRDLLKPEIAGLFHNMDDYQQSSYTYPASKQFDIKEIKQLFLEPEYIIRAKGYVNIGNSWILFNVVMGEFNYQKVTKKDCNRIVLIRHSTIRKGSYEPSISEA